jgi:hypothetical protein
VSLRRLSWPASRYSREDSFQELGCEHLRWFHDRTMEALPQVWGMIDYRGQTIRDFEGQIEVVIAPFRSPVANLRTMPGIIATAAYVTIAEIGVDRSRFQTIAHLRS